MIRRQYDANTITDVHQDLARIYQNQPEVAEGMKRAISEVPGLKREDIFIVSYQTIRLPHEVFFLIAM